MRVRNRNETVISHCGAEEGSLQRRPKLKTSKLTFFLGGKKKRHWHWCAPNVELWSMWGATWQGSPGGHGVGSSTCTAKKKKNYFCCPLQLQCVTSCRCSFSISMLVSIDISVSLVKDRIPLQ